VDEGEGRALVKCHAACATEAVVGALGLIMADLFDDRREGTTSTRRPATPRAKAPRAAMPERPLRWTHAEENVAAVHPYLDGDALAFEVVRFSKEARERGLPKCKPRYRGPDGRFYQGLGPWKGRTDAPLYREGEALEELRQGGTVYVVEGEADADALGEAGVAASCNVGGAGKFREAHAGRLAAALREGVPHARIIVVADNDAAGEKHAAEVRVKLVRAGVPADLVQIVKPAVTHEHADASDHLKAGLSLAALVPVDPASSVPDKTAELAVDGVRAPFRLLVAGVEIREEIHEAGDRPRIEWRRVCSRLEVLAVTRDEHGEEWGRLLRVQDADGRLHEWAMPMRMLAGDGTDLRAHLLALGLELEPGRKAREWLHAYLTSTKPRSRVRCVSRIGWHGRAFVLPDAVFGVAGTEPVRLQVSGAFEHAFRVAGTLEEWQRDIARLCEGNSRLVLALCAAFAAPLLALVEAESGGFHLRGASSIGKTTALLVGGSVFGGGGLRGYVRQWRATANGLEVVAVAHCDTLLCLDELSQVDAREAGAVAYMLANGAGKTRASREVTLRKVPEWRLLFLSSGELSLSDKVREDGRGRATAGQAVRIVDVPADAERELGLFEDLHGFKRPAALAIHLRGAVEKRHGVAAHAFLEAVASDLESVTVSVREARAVFVEKACPPGADGQVRRVAERFGLLAAAGELAAERRVLPWKPGSAEAGVRACFDAWLAERGTAGPAELAAGVEQVRAFFASHGSSRFEPIHDGNGDVRVPNRAGWYRNDGRGGREWLVPPNVFKAELARGFDAKTLARELVEQGHLLRDREGKTSQVVTIPGAGKVRVYRFLASVLGGDE
jgi:uncharacterized protein (DUF927 family)/5S rRNA maturation endonuclease (ribonuclease M5)